MSFDNALELFKKTGRFELINDQLTPLNFAELRKVLINAPAPHQVYLKNIELFPGSNVERAIKTGIVNEHTFKWNDKQTDVSLYRWSTQPNTVSVRRFDSDSIENIFESSQTMLEKAFLELLSLSDSWQVIKLKQISYTWCGIKRELSSYFFDNFFQYLSENLYHLKELDVKDMYISPERLVEILINNSRLTYLSYEISPSQMSYFIEFFKQIEIHPGLKKLDLGNTLISIKGYKILSKLLDKNYRIEEINIKTPDNASLQQPHQVLIQRLSQNPVDRFKNEQLNQAKLLALAEKSLAEKNDSLQLMLKLPDHLPNINWSENKKREFYDLFPDVYRANRAHIENDKTLIQLDLHEKLETNPSLTIGCYLLAKAAESLDEIRTRYLLEAGANPLEKFSEISLLMRVLKEKKETEWSKVILTYVQQGLGTLSPQLKQLEKYIDVYNKINEISDHLTNYLEKLDKRNHRPFIINLISGIAFHIEERKKELEKALTRMIDLINMGTKEKEVTSAIVREMCQFIKPLLEDVKEAKKGLRNFSHLNDGLEKLFISLKNDLKKLKKELIWQEHKQEFETELQEKYLNDRQQVEQKENETNEKLRIKEKQSEERDKYLKHKLEEECLQRKIEKEQYTIEIEQLKAEREQDTIEIKELKAEREQDRENIKTIQAQLKHLLKILPDPTTSSYLEEPNAAAKFFKH